MESSRGAAVVDINLQAIDPTRRGEVWSGVLREHYYPLDAQVPDRFGRAHLESCQVGDVRVGTLVADPMLVRRDDTHARLDGDEFFTFMVPMPKAGPITLSQYGREATTDPTAIAFVGTAEPYSYEQPGRGGLQTLLIPADVVRARIPVVDRFAAVRFDQASNPIAALVLAFARAFCSNAPKLADSLAAGVEDQLLNLLALMMTNAGPRTDDSAVRAAHRQRAVHVIESRFRDSEFTANDVATAINLSERYLQKVLADHGETVSGMIRTRRLAEARRLLAKRHVAGTSVASIAQSVGFTDAAYFSRVFRQETGMAPRTFSHHPTPNTRI